MSPETTLTTRDVKPFLHAERQKPDKHVKPKRQKQPWYVRLAKCVCRSQRKKEKMEKAMDADQAFWATFYRAYDALCTPVILGEIEKHTLDVRIVYANQAACDFTGYELGERSKRNPHGLVGRSVMDLMEEDLKYSHTGYVAGWLQRRGILKSHDTSMHSGSESESTDRNRMKAVEGISRRVTMMTRDGRLKSADAALSFFTAKGLKKVVGIFSFLAAEELDVVRLSGLTFHMQYKPPYSDEQYYVVVNPPDTLNDFSEDEEWRITAVSEGIILKTGDLNAIKQLIRNQIFYHLSKISIGSGLDITFVKSDKLTLSHSDMRKTHAALVESINDSKSQENMHMSVSKSKKRAERLQSFESFRSTEEDED